MYKEKFKDLLMKKAKAGKYLGEDDAKAKMEMVEMLEGMMDDSMSDKIKGMKKVEVASNSKEGLVEGLEKAEDVVEEMPEEMMMEDSEEESEMEEEMEMEDGEEEMSKEDRIKKLEEEIAMLKAE